MTPHHEPSHRTRPTLRLHLLVLACVLGTLAPAQQSPDDEWYLPLDDRRVMLFVRELGDGEDPVVVLHGGWGAEHGYLLGLLQPHLDRCRFVAYDQRGSLRSPASVETITVAQHIADLEALRQELGLSSMRILAHSMGTFLAMSYLGEHPDRVRDLVLLGAIPAHFDGEQPLGSFLQGGSSELMQREAVRREAELLQLPDHPSARQQTEAWRLRFASVNLHHVDRWRLMPGGQAYYAAESGAAAARSMPTEWDFRPLLRAHPHPVHVIVGESDFVDPGGERWRTIAAECPTLQLQIVPAAGHAAWIDQPESIAQRLAGCLGTAGPVDASSANGEPRAVLNPGDLAPALSLGRWLKGEPLTELARGRVHVVEFWATWCGPCRKAMPHLTELATRHAADVTVLGVSVWEPDEAKVDPFVAEAGAEIGYPIARDRLASPTVDASTGDMARSWLSPAGVSGIPCTFVVDRDGVIAWIGNPTQLDDVLERVLDGTWDLQASRARYVAARRGPEARQAALDALEAQDWAKAERMAAEAVDHGVAEMGIVRYAALCRLDRATEAAALGEQLLAKFASQWPMLEYLSRIVTEPPVHSARTDLDLALAAAEKAVSLLDAWPTRTTLAHVLFLRGDRERATAMLSAALEDVAPEEQHRQKFERRLQLYRSAAAPSAEQPLTFLGPLLGQWSPLDHPEHIVMELCAGIGPFSMRLREGFPAGQPDRAQLDGLVHHDPVTGTIGFEAVAGASAGQGRVFHGEYRALEDGAIERTYDVHYRSLADIPAEDLGGLTRRFREVYRIDGINLVATLDWWHEGRWQPFGPGRFQLRKHHQ